MSLNRFMIFRTLAKCKISNFIPITTREFSGGSENNQGWKWKPPAVVLLGSVLVVSALSDELKTKQKPGSKQDKSESSTVEAGAKRPDLPTYRAEEISKHDTKDNFWVTYKHGVYDITKFLPSHPGGEQIYNAAGLSVEPFWNVYGMHKTEDIFKLLESYRIGNLHDDDIVDHSEAELWAKEPFRDSRLIVKTARPFNAEIPPQYQIAHFDTPNELFYVRQHMPVPELSAETHRLRVQLKKKGGDTETVFSLQQLEQMPQTTVRAALMCAGNRRSEMNKQVSKDVKGISWAGGAISNAVWGGVLLVDVLKASGLDLEDVKGKHIVFTGSDMDATGSQFSTSLPLGQALEPSSLVLLATRMNGRPLPPDHGCPLRVVVPGAPAVRSVKWLESITVSEEESTSHWHQRDYRSFNPSATWESADFSSAPPVYSLPVTSAICYPNDGDTVRVVGGRIQVKGYAYSGGGAKVMRVDITANGGAEWQEAQTLAQDDAPPRQHYSWMLWTADVPVRPGQKQMELWVKATDSNFNTQPERFDHIWNIRGILGNAYHKITVKLIH